MSLHENSSQDVNFLDTSHTIAPGLLNDEVTVIFHIVSLASLATAVSTFGIATNIINIIVFFKQGLSDTVNVSLFALAVADLCSLLSLQWLCLLRNPLLLGTGWPVLVSDIYQLTALRPHIFWTRMTSWVTAYIMLERLLCVLIPLKVKRVVTPKLAVIVLVSIFVLMVLTLIPDYATSNIDWKFIPDTNTSMLGLFFTAGREEMATLGFSLAAYTQTIPFVLIIILTVVLVVKIKQMFKWRATVAYAGQTCGKHFIRRDTKSVNIIILIAIIYSVCMAPLVLMFLTVVLVPEFSTTGQYRNVFLVCWSLAFLLDSINSSITIFVYCRMGTKYRATFDAMLVTCKLKETLWQLSIFRVWATDSEM